MKHARTILYILICIISVGFVNHYWDTSKSLTAIWVGIALLGWTLIAHSYEDVN